MAVNVSVSHRAPATARLMAEAANRFLELLSAKQRAAATFPFEGDERFQWNYTPANRNGLRLINMTKQQQEAALALLDVGLSARGARTVRAIIELETDLRIAEAIEQHVNQWFRDPDVYWFSLFGQPGGAAPWAWRAGGHHVGVHFAVIDREHVSPLPLFFGANPAEVRHGPNNGKRTLPEEEDWARALFKSFDAEQRSRALVDPVAPADHHTRNYPFVHATQVPLGLAFQAMSGEQRGRLVDLLKHYVERVGDEVASNEWNRIEQAGLETVTFAWAGGEEPGQGHYYAIRGPRFLIEYDNTQNNANHIHTVWRDPEHDWGMDLLAEHYAAAHRS